MNNKKIKFLFWIFWISVIIMAIWIIIKLLGLVKTPLIFEILPSIAGFISLITIGMILGNNFQKTNFTFEKINKMENRQNKMAIGLINIEKDISIIKQDIGEIKEKIK